MAMVVDGFWWLLVLLMVVDGCWWFWVVVAAVIAVGWLVSYFMVELQATNQKGN